MSSMNKWALAACMMVLLTARASSKVSPPLPGFQRVTLTTEGTTREDLKADSTTGKVAAGAAGGAAGGATAGAAIGLACGPLALFCIPVGIIVDGVTGAAAGGITQGGKGLSTAHSAQVNEVLQTLHADLDISDILHAELSHSLPEAMQTDEAHADALVRLHVSKLELLQHSDERVSLRLTAEVHSLWDRQSSKPAEQTNAYEFETAREFVEDWLAEDGAGFRLGLDQCVKRVASRMARDLNGSQSL